MLHDLEKNVEEEMANLKEILERKESELKEVTFTVNISSFLQSFFAF